ncbi:MAG: tetratricopeptide repeat protein [Deltaproteobacteria bacterium]|nr:tetratricopeptide repeat protein [Deltaproteobacteria bacterium]
MAKWITVLVANLAISTATFGLSAVRQLLVENRLDDALGICRQYEVLKTNDRDNLFSCAWVYYRLDKTEAAEKLMSQLRSAYSTPEYQLLTAYRLLKKKEFDQAKKILDLLETEHKKAPVGITAQELKGELFELKGQLETAAFLYKQIINDDPKRGRAHWGLGRNYLAKGENQRAIEHFEQATRLWPKHIGSRFNLGVIYLGTEDLKQSARWFTECYRIDKGDPSVLEYLGLLFEKKGMTKEAVKYWQRAYDIKVESAVAKEKLAKHYSDIIDEAIAQEQYDKALAYLEAARDFVEQPKLLLRRGMIYRRLQDYEKAAGDLLAFLNSQPRNPTALREVGVCYLNLRLLNQASESFSKAIAEEPQNGINHAWMAFLLEGKGDLSRAREEWKRAIELLKDPAELEKATRRLAIVERKLKK